MQIQIYRPKPGHKNAIEIIAWLYIDCDDDKLIDSVLLNDYGIKVGKTLKAKEVKENG